LVPDLQPPYPHKLAHSYAELVRNGDEKRRTVLIVAIAGSA
jgi:hypothetical protein